ncbi:MAG: hypothetical protein ABJB03_01495 [Rhodoglobus sp.]
METPWIVAAVLAGVWVLSLLFQLGDLGTSTFDASTAHDGERRGRVSRQRTRGLFWVVPFASVVLVGIGVGVDFASRLFFDLGQPLLGLVLALALGAAAAGAALVLIVGLVSDSAIDYRDLRDELRSAGTERISRDEIAGLRRWLAAIDGERRGGRARVPSTPAAIGYLFSAGIVRILPVLIGLAVSVAVVVAVGERQLPWLIVLGFLVPVLSGGLAVAGSQAFLRAEAAWRDVHEKQRAETVRLLTELERRSVKRNAGLGDRVTRALQILREQQG